MFRQLLLLCCVLGFAGAAEGERIPLWNGQAPLGDGTFETPPADATITVHRAEQSNGAALVICPGGGYGGRVSGGEGHGIAAWLNKHGVTGIVLDYRLPKGRHAVPLLDAQQAIRLTRAHAKEWSIDPKRIGIIGFSAGGHLASSATTLFEPGDSASADVVAQQSSRPDFSILIYPVISMGDGVTHGGSRINLLGKEPSAALIARYSTDLQISADTPPVFLAHALDDKVVPIENTRLFAVAMKAQNRPVALLELPNGGHGLNGYKGPSWDAWQHDSLAWMATLHIIPADESQ